MPGVRQEDARMKIPALIHLCRLGYGYLPRRIHGRDRETGLIPDILRKALARINGREPAEEEFRRLLDALRDRMEREDLGQAFYAMIRDGWEGLRLIDFYAPERNRFGAAPEAACARDGAVFRPDITLYVNGLPLAMIEVKTGRQPRGIRAEYDRMMERFRRKAFRPFLQAAQVWAFCNDRENDPNRLLPTEGACYGTAAEGDFCLHAFQEGAPGSLPALEPRNRETEALILKDCGMDGRIAPGELRRNLSPKTAAHRMLSGLFSPERFLFFLRYGIRFETEDGGARKRLLSSAQFFALWRQEMRLRQGRPGGMLPAAGAAGETGMLVSLLIWAGERIPGSRTYWIAPDRTELLRTDAELRARGIRAGRRGRPEGCGTLLAEPAEFPAGWTEEPGEREFAGRRIFLIPADWAASPRGKSLLRRLREADPHLIRILRQRSALPEKGNYTYLVECADGSLYCGWTDDLEGRVRKHNEGRGARYTRSRRPVRLVYAEAFGTRQEAMSREWHLKRLTRKEKLRLIQERDGAETEEKG